MIEPMRPPGPVTVDPAEALGLGAEALRRADDNAWQALALLVYAAAGVVLAHRSTGKVDLLGAEEAIGPAFAEGLTAMRRAFPMLEAPTAGSRTQ